VHAAIRGIEPLDEQSAKACHETKLVDPGVDILSLPDSAMSAIRTPAGEFASAEPAPMTILVHAPAALSTADSPQTVSDSSVALPSARKLRVLLAEDHGPTARLMQVILSKLGCEVHVVENGALAVQALTSDSYAASAPFNLILMDGTMPELGTLVVHTALRISRLLITYRSCFTDGYEATTKLRSLGLQTPIIALTGNALAEDQQRFLAAGAQEVLTKPILRHHLEAVVRRYHQASIT